MTELHLSSERRWTGVGPVAVRGHAFRGDDLLSGESLCDHFADVETLSGFADALDALNGFFAVAVDGADGVLLGVDHVRSVPLVYAPAPDHVDGVGTGLAGDDVAAIAKRLDGPYDPLAESEFLVSGGVLDDRTLLPELRTVRPGEAVRLADGASETVRYSDFRPRVDDTTATSASGDRTARERLETAIDDAFDRFSEVVGDRQVAVALSGGYDSRLLVTELAQRDVDLLTYSFGRPDAEDVRVARDVAAALEVPWEFVEYSTEQWSAWYRSPERPAYVERAFTYDTIPNYGSLPAVSRLRQREVIDDGAVCSSGQTIVGVSENVPH
jgi:asparagine synthase (glutamine-hydrolysing)